MGFIDRIFRRKKKDPQQLFIIGFADLAERDDVTYPMFHFYAGSGKYTTISNHAAKFTSRKAAWSKILQLKEQHRLQYFLIFELY